jgi:hypothetical protein
MNTNNNLYLGIEKVFENGSQPFEMLNENGGNGWYAPSAYLKNQPGVVKCELLNTTSSAGDWDGYYAVESGEGIALIGFSQANRYPQGPGYVLYTDEASFAVVENVDDIEPAVNEWERNNIC